MSNQLLNKYAEIISSLKASNGIKVVSVEEIQDNEVFLMLKDSFESYFSEISETLKGLFFKAKSRNFFIMKFFLV
jgi:hypothetical protein